MPVMAYAPLGESSLVHDPTLARIRAAYGCSAAAVALAWAIRSGNVIAIPKSGFPTHVKENAVALSLTLTQRDLQTLDAAYPPPAISFLSTSVREATRGELACTFPWHRRAAQLTQVWTAVACVSHEAAPELW